MDILKTFKFTFLIKSRNAKFRFAHAKNRSFETTMS